MAPFTWQLRQWQQLQSSLQHDRLPHALLLSGMQGLGKTAFAQAFSQRVLCHHPAAQGMACGNCKSCQLLRAQTHPDYYWLAPVADSTTISIEQVRQLTTHLHTTPHCGDYAVAVICPAEALNAAASHALLKTLEEPPGQVLIILVSHQPEQLTKTIRSRCQQLVFTLPSAIEVTEWLAPQLPRESSDISTLLALSHGAPLHALALSQGNGLAEQQQWMAELTAFMRNDYELTQLAQIWAKRTLSTVVAQLSSCLLDIIQWRMVGKRSVYGERIGAMCTHIPVVESFHLLDKLYDAQRSLNGFCALNSQLLLEDLLYHWQCTLIRGSV